MTPMAPMAQKKTFIAFPYQIVDSRKIGVVGGRCLDDDAGVQPMARVYDASSVGHRPLCANQPALGQRSPKTLGIWREACGKNLQHAMTHTSWFAHNSWILTSPTCELTCRTCDSHVTCHMLHESWDMMQIHRGSG
jgi:hypothetical protein